MEARPALTHLVISERRFGQLSGLTLKNIGIKLFVDGKEAYSDFGEMLFTHDGVSGPVILSASFHVPADVKDTELLVDFKPAMSYEEVDKRLIRELEMAPNMSLKNVFSKLLPVRLSELLLEINGIEGYVKSNSVSKKMRSKLTDILKCTRLLITSTGGFDEAIITRGGVDVSAIDPKTFASKSIKGVYFAGEVIDVAAYTGGYNLQIAWSSGRAAGSAAREYVRDMI